MEREEYRKLRDIFSAIDVLEFRPSKGRGFSFPIYMTDSLGNTEIDALELSVRSINCLRRAGIHTIGDLCARVQCSGDLKTIRNCGKTSIAEIMDHLFAYHFYQLKPERRDKYLAEVIQKNMRKYESDTIH